MYQSVPLTNGQWCINLAAMADTYEFHLPAHKADQFFEGNRIIVWAEQFQHNPLTHFKSYLTSRDNLHPLLVPLWLTSNGLIPTRSWFISHLQRFFPPSIVGQSMQASGATSLAEHGVAPSLIQAMGRWSSQAFLIYIRKSPALIQGLLFACARSSAH